MRGRTISIVVSGSFRKHLLGIQETIRRFESLDIKVLSPKHARPLNPDDAFVFLETDDVHDPGELERRHLEAIRSADALYIFNPDGYIGLSVAMELGWTLALGKRVFASAVVTDVTLKNFACTVATPKQVKDALTTVPPPR